MAGIPPHALEGSFLMAQRVAYSGTNAQYVGYAAPGTKDGDKGWMIHLLTYNSSSLMTSRKFAGGTAAFDKMWTKRTEYSYA